MFLITYFIGFFIGITIDLFCVNRHFINQNLFGKYPKIPDLRLMDSKKAICRSLEEYSCKSQLLVKKVKNFYKWLLYKCFCGKNDSQIAHTLKKLFI